MPFEEAGSEFAGFSAGAGSAAGCTGTGPCSFKLEANSSVTASFNLEPVPEFTLTVKKAGTGTGTVECEVEGGLPEPCAAKYPEGTGLILLAKASPGSEFSHWSGACSFAEELEECNLTMEGSRSVTATFNLWPSLKVTKSGTGTGSVTCEAQEGEEPCAERYPKETYLTLRAKASLGSKFSGWSGDCSFAGLAEECEIEMTANKSVGAKFDLEPVEDFELKIIKTGSGTVTSSPAGINCGTTCSAKFEKGKEVELTATAAGGSKFAGWATKSGSPGTCTGTTTPCKVTINAAVELEAKFDPVPKFKLEIEKAGTGSGTVTSSPAGINCGSECSAEYEEGKEVTLTATAAGGSKFIGWSTVSGNPGTCTGTTLPCKVTMNAAVKLKATFDPVPKFKLTVTKSGTGTGTVTSSPAGINCGATCEAEFETGKEVTLSQAAGSGSVFVEWTGACSGSGACKVTMSGAKSVGAVFNAQPGSGSGGRSGAGGGRAAPGTATAATTAMVKGGKALLKLTCSGGPCRGSLKLTAKIKQGKKTKSLVIGQASFRLAAAASATLNVKLSGPARQELAKGKKIKAKMTGTGVTSATIRLKPANSEKKR